MGLAGRRPVLTQVFQQIEARNAHELGRIKLIWRNRMWRRP
jgi:hypothetical protein